MVTAPLEHRMADPVVRRRVALLAVAIVALSWGAVRLAGSPGGPFGRTELRDLSGVPIVPPQIEDRVPPPPNPLEDLTRQLEDLTTGLSGPAPSAAPGGR